MSQSLSPKKVRTSTLGEFKAAGRKFSALTSYDHLTAGIFDAAGIDVLLVGDSAADAALGLHSTLAITVDELIPFGRAVASSAKRALVVLDLPFGSYEVSAEQALVTAIDMMKRTGVQALKLEGGVRSQAQIQALVTAGIPVMGHVGFTPQSVHSLGGFKVQGRGEAAAELLAEAKAVEAAGAFAVVLEMVPADVAQMVTRELTIPTIGIGAGPGCDGQILVWTDMAGLDGGKPRKFVKRFANLHQTLTDAALQYRAEIAAGSYPSSDHSFE